MSTIEELQKLYFEYKTALINFKLQDKVIRITSKDIEQLYNTLQSKILLFNLNKHFEQYFIDVIDFLIKFNKQENYKQIFNIFYYVFNFEFNNMIYRKPKLELNNLTNENIISLLYQCIYYINNVYYDYIYNSLYDEHIIHHQKFILITNKEKNKYIKDNDTIIIFEVFKRIRNKFIINYVNESIKNIKTILPKCYDINYKLYEYILNNSALKDDKYKNYQFYKFIEKYFIKANTLKFNKEYILEIPNDDLHYLINNN